MKKVVISRRKSRHGGYIIVTDARSLYVLTFAGYENVRSSSNRGYMKRVRISSKTVPK